MSSTRAMDGIPGGARRSYMSTEVFNQYFFSYVNTGTPTVPNWILTPVTADPSQCPAGRVLRENGRKLYPGVNPGVTQYWIGVFDARTFLNGFIDPNAFLFTEYNNDKQIYIDDNGSEGSVGSADLDDLGEPVYTNGNVVVNANGSNYISIQDTPPGDERINAAYMTIGSDYFMPYVGVEGNFQGEGPFMGNTQQAYLGANPFCSYLDLQFNTSTIVALCATTLGDGPGGPSGPFGPSAGVFVNSSLNPAYVSVQNDISGSNAAYLGMTQSPWEPYFGIVATSDTSQTTAYLGGSPDETYLSLQDPTSTTTVYLTSGDGTLSYPPAVYTTGVLNPVNTCGQVKLNGSGGGVTFDNQYASVAGALIFLTRAGGAAHAGLPFYSIGGPGNSTITIQSTDNQDDGYINYMIVSNNTFGVAVC